MPPVSQAQRRAMYAAAAGKSNIGIPQKVGEEFTAADQPGKLPERAPKKKRRLRIGNKTYGGDDSLGN